MLLCKRAETGRSFIFLRYTLFAMIQLVQLCTLTKHVLSAAEMDKILCILDRIRLKGKIAVLEGSDLETGKQRLLSLFRRGDDKSDLQKDGQPAGRLLLININNMVSTETAKVEVDLQGDGLTLVALASCQQLTYDTNAAKPFFAMILLGPGCKWGEHGVIPTRG